MIYRVKCPECEKMTDVYFETLSCNFFEVFECEECNEKFALHLDITVKHEAYKLTKDSVKPKRKTSPKPKTKKPGRKKPGPKPIKKMK